MEKEKDALKEAKEKTDEKRWFVTGLEIEAERLERKRRRSIGKEV